MFFEQKTCVYCYGNDIFKVPSVEYTGKKPTESPKKTGKIVDSYIKDAKEEIKQEKEALKKEEL